MTGKRTKYSGDFKAKVALEAIKSEMTLAQLSAKHGVINSWKGQAIGYDVGRKRVRRLMARMDLQPVYQKPTTTSGGVFNCRGANTLQFLPCCVARPVDPKPGNRVLK